MRGVPGGPSVIRRWPFQKASFPPKPVTVASSDVDDRELLARAQLGTFGQLVERRMTKKDVDDRVGEAVLVLVEQSTHHLAFVEREFRGRSARDGRRGERDVRAAVHAERRGAGRSRRRIDRLVGGAEATEQERACKTEDDEMAHACAASTDVPAQHGAHELEEGELVRQAQSFAAPRQIQARTSSISAAGSASSRLGICEPEHMPTPSSLFIR